MFQKNDHKYKNWRFHKSRVCQCLTNYQNNNFASFMKKYNIINVYPLSNCLFFSAYLKFLKLYRYVSSGYAWYRQTHVNVRQSYIIKYDECSKNVLKIIANLSIFGLSIGPCPSKYSSLALINLANCIRGVESLAH